MTVRVRKETEDQIRFLADKSGLTQTQLLAEIIGAVFQIGCTFDSINYEYEYDLTNAKVTICVTGKNRLTVSEQKMDAKTLAQESKAPILTVKFKPKVKGEK